MFGLLLMEYSSNIPHTYLLGYVGGHEVEYLRNIPLQVDHKCLRPGYLSKGKLAMQPVHVGTDCDGKKLYMEVVNPALALATLFFHPCNFPHMYMRAEAEYGKEEHVDAWLGEHGFETRAVDLGVTTATELLRLADSTDGAKELLDSVPKEGKAIVGLLQDAECTLRHGLPRVYGHAFSCDKAIAAQAVVDAKPVVDGEKHVLLGVQWGSDKTDASALETVHPQHAKVTNIKPSRWFRRHSKIQISSFASWTWDPALKDQENTVERFMLYQKQMTVDLVLLEECARNGIRCIHKSPPSPPHPPLNTCGQ